MGLPVGALPSFRQAAPHSVSQALQTPGSLARCNWNGDQTCEVHLVKTGMQVRAARAKNAPRMAEIC